uniref:Uncharacterized protein n=1 Tax=Molossus molossus TaxID=27622 RepID=A0A7J8HHK4_MOLMO|nr:hypothetical protein HJG59_010941 [Molossus molossus]
MRRLGFARQLVRVGRLCDDDHDVTLLRGEAQLKTKARDKPGPARSEGLAQRGTPAVDLLRSWCSEFGLQSLQSVPLVDPGEGRQSDFPRRCVLFTATLTKYVCLASLSPLHRSEEGSITAGGRFPAVAFLSLRP